MKKTTTTGVGPGWTATGHRKVRRTSSVGRSLGSLLVWFVVSALKFVFGVANAAGATIASIVRVVAPPVAHVTVVVAVVAGLVLAVAHYGSIGADRALAFAHAKIGEAHRESVAGLEKLWAQVPRLEPSTPAPRAVAVVEPVSSPIEEEPKPSSGVRLVKALGGLDGLLFPEGSEYPQPAKLPPLDGEILEKAGGHDIQRLISDIRLVVREVESTGGKSLQGDFINVTHNGQTERVPLAFGEYQTRAEVTQDLERIYGVKIDPRDCEFDPVLAEYTLRLYLGYWGNHFRRKSGAPPSDWDLCVAWNCGPDRGPDHKAREYWAKCLRAMEHIGTTPKLAAR